MTPLTISYREHPELGQVKWLRQYDQALALAAKQAKPVLLLFQEVPGCATCRNFGRDVLSHPLMVEAVHELFVPLAIFNNQPGPDAATLARFGEPAWNNPVVHFIAPDGTAIVPKLENRYDAVGLHEKMLGALEARGVDAPAYFRLLRGDLLVETDRAAHTAYTTPCFWSGETSLAQHPAVIETDAGWIGGEEVVRIGFDPGATNIQALDDFAAAEGFQRIAARSFRLDSEPQFYLRKSRFRYLPLSPAQRTAINLALPYGRDAEELLGPQQRRWLGLERLEALSNPEMYRSEIGKAWTDIEAASGEPEKPDGSQAT